MMVWHLKRGDRFKIEGSDEVFVFEHMDGLYCYAKRESDGAILNWSGPVEKLP